jgi:hypothetical protein
MRFLRKYKAALEEKTALIEEQTQRIAALEADVATYRHAFESTAADRDRLQDILHDLQPASAKEKTAAPGAQPRSEIGNVPLYGALWGKVADDYQTIAADGVLDQSGFEAIVHYGGFSQFAMNTDARLLESLIDWQIATLKEMGAPLDGQPESHAEAAVFPDSLCLERAGRRVSPDFLRLLAYAHTIDQQMAIARVEEPRVILEIGSGHGGLARLMKLRHANATVCLIDLPACLMAAAFYLQQSMPDLRIVWLRDLDGDLAASGADFILIPADEADGLHGQTIDLAINIWSFGEMPNTQIATWFELIQERNNTRHLYLLNHFMAPLPAELGNVRQHASHYGWLNRMDADWQVQSFTVDPAIERPPLVRHKHRGLQIFANRIKEPDAIARERERAARAVESVHLQDWVLGSLRQESSGETDADAARRSIVTQGSKALGAHTAFALDRFDRTLRLWRPDTDGGMEGAFFRLWNDLRLNHNPLSLRLLRIWFHLSWRPILRTEEGDMIETMLREEVLYAMKRDGSWAADPLLELPPWMTDHLERC